MLAVMPSIHCITILLMKPDLQDLVMHVEEHLRVKITLLVLHGSQLYVMLIYYHAKYV